MKISARNDRKIFILLFFARIKSAVSIPIQFVARCCVVVPIKTILSTRFLLYTKEFSLLFSRRIFYRAFLFFNLPATILSHPEKNVRKIRTRKRARTLRRSLQSYRRNNIFCFTKVFIYNFIFLIFAQTLLYK